ncbi:CRISPR-associated RAMP protein Csx7 [Scytonema sp. PCC 10023]|uniref:type III CRISPR-associated RAMP protein Csx7 n=1 Tax=Scytonema sp. PCC 10023 TaxID=1680591 RepID=UPI0039C5D4A9
MFDTFKNRLEITGTLTTITALRISAGRSSEPIGSDLPVIKDALGNPLIPGSSFKGALRSRLESFLRGIVGNNRKLVANPAIEDEWSLTSREIRDIKELNLEQLITLHQVQVRETDDFKDLSLEEIIERIIEDEYLLPENELKNLKQEYNNDSAFTAVIQQNTDLVSHLFGSPWLASKFQVRDLTIIPDTWFGQYQERDGVAIDRDTETAADGKLYDFQVVPAGTQFEFRAVVENAEEWELGLLMIGLHQFETEQVPLGGGRSRGLGVVKLDINEMLWFDYPKDQPELLLDYLKKLVMGDNSAYEDARDFKDHWVQKLIEHLESKASHKNNTEAKR